VINRQQFYVSISRARVDAQVFTNDREQLSRAVTREVQQPTAVEAVRESQRNEDRSRGQDSGRHQTQKDFTMREIPPIRQLEWRHKRVGGGERTVAERTE
jgi:hypothetical protein